MYIRLCLSKDRRTTVHMPNPHARTTQTYWKLTTYSKSLLLSPQRWTKLLQHSALHPNALVKCEPRETHCAPIVEVSDLKDHQKFTINIEHLKWTWKWTSCSNFAWTNLDMSFTSCAKMFETSSKLNMYHAQCNNLVMTKDRSPTCALWVDLIIVFIWKNDVGLCNPYRICPFRT